MSSINAISNQSLYDLNLQFKLEVCFKNFDLRIKKKTTSSI